MLTKKQKWISALGVLALFACAAPRAGAMHIAEGFLPVGYSVAWGALCLPFLAAGVFAIRGIVEERRRALLLLAMAGAYAFVLSALKLPSVTGSSSHPTGMGLGTVLFGPAPMAVVGMIVLLFQALLLAHGGLTTLGANTFSMGIAGPFAAWGVYRLSRKLGASRMVSVFLAAALADLLTYCVTSLQLALAHPDPAGGVGASLAKFLAVFAVTQIPLAVVEGLLTAVVLMGLKAWAKPELRELGYLEGGTAK